MVGVGDPTSLWIILFDIPATWVMFLSSCWWRWRWKQLVVSVSMRSILCGLLTSREHVSSPLDDVIDDATVASHYSTVCFLYLVSMCAYCSPKHTFEMQFRWHSRSRRLVSLRPTATSVTFSPQWCHSPYVTWSRQVARHWLTVGALAVTFPHGDRRPWLRCRVIICLTGI